MNTGLSAFDNLDPVSSVQVMPALLLLPCFAWIAFFFLLPLAVMVSKSLVDHGFSLAAYAALFTSPLYTKVMLTTVKAACIATVLAVIVALLRR